VTQKRLGSYTARQNLMTHPRYRYRGCAPDVDDQSVAAGNLGVPVTAWEAPDADGGESQPDRVRREAAAIEVCVECPVMVQCLAYGSSLNRAGRLAVPHGVLGGMTALERHKEFVRERQVVPVVVEPAPVEQLRTGQKLAILRALAVFEAPEDVARAAGLDLRTANWQRARLVTQLGLPKSASRAQVLEAAAARGLLEEGDGVAARLSSVSSRPVQLTLDDVLSSASVTELFPPGPELGVAV
jgi:hypothetical protein